MQRSLAMHKRRPSMIPSRPNNILVQAYDTMIAVCREMAYPQIYWLSGSFTRYLNPPALGRCLLLLMYWVVILTAIWTNTILTPSSPNYAYKWEIVGFRAAWVSVTQLPLIYCLGGKINVVSLITGISYERLNWLHRWIARTLFLTVIIHWSFFFREWWIADFVNLELEMMPIVKFGFGAWSVLGWMVITGFGFFRELFYEFFVLQHIASLTVLLWLLYIHLPSYAKYNVWLAIGFVAFDHVSRLLLLIIQNLHLRSTSIRKKQKYMFGFSAQAGDLTDDHLLLTIDNVDIPWRAGQHIYVSIPCCGWFQSHPFTIAGLPGSGNIKIILKVHSGFTRKLLQLTRHRPHREFRTFISSPYGSPPLNIVERSDSLIMMATSTGASFTVPIMQHAINKTTSIRRICFYWVVRHPSHVEWFSSDILPALQKAQLNGVKVCVQVYITQLPDDPAFRPSDATSSSTSMDINILQGQKRNSTEGFMLLPDQETAKNIQTTTNGSQKSADTESYCMMSDVSQHKSTLSILPTTYGRPASFDTLILPTIEESDGETSIIACGSAAFLAELRNYTAALSDERAVHKGTGAQGIFLFTETYGW
jgi:predicted ferric reductase